MFTFVDSSTRPESKPPVVAKGGRETVRDLDMYGLSHTDGISTSGFLSPFGDQDNDLLRVIEFKDSEIAALKAECQRMYRVMDIITYHESLDPVKKETGSGLQSGSELEVGGRTGCEI